MVSAGLQWLFRISKQILPLRFMLGWYTLVVKLILEKVSRKIEILWVVWKDSLLGYECPKRRYHRNMDCLPMKGEKDFFSDKEKSKPNTYRSANDPWPMKEIFIYWTCTTRRWWLSSKISEFLTQVRKISCSGKITFCLVNVWSIKIKESKGWVGCKRKSCVRNKQVNWKGEHVLQYV